MDRIEKFLNSVPHLRKRLAKVLRLIGAGKLADLDVKPLQGEKNVFRVRVGNVRILFMRRGEFTIAFDIGFRGDVYKKRR